MLHRCVRAPRQAAQGVRWHGAVQILPTCPVAMHWYQCCCMHGSFSFLGLYLAGRNQLDPLHGMQNPGRPYSPCMVNQCLACPFVSLREKVTEARNGKSGKGAVTRPYVTPRYL